jgi:hypothetical protein
MNNHKTYCRKKPKNWLQRINWLILRKERQIYEFTYCESLICLRNHMRQKDISIMITLLPRQLIKSINSPQ